MIDLGSQIQSQTFANQNRDSVKSLSDTGASRSDFDRSLKELDSKNTNRDLPRVQDESENKVTQLESREPKELESSHSSSNSRREVTNQTAMEVFLDRMNQELGVEPEDVLKAFAELDEAELNGAPEDSAAAFIDKLGLKEEESTKALGMYNQMLAMTAAAGMSQFLAKNNQEAKFQIVDKKEAQLQTLRHSLNDLSDRFFVTGPHTMMKPGVDRQADIAAAYQAQMRLAMKNQPEQDSLSAQPTISGEKMKLDGALLVPPSSGALGMGQIQSGAEFTAPAVNPTLGASQYSEGAIDVTDLDSIDASIEELGIDTSQPLQVPTVQVPNAANVKVGGPSFGTSAGMGLNGLSAVGGELGSGEAASNGSDFGSDENEEGTQDLESKDLRGNHTQGVSTNGKSTQSQFVVGAPVANDADVQENVKEIISQAKFLAQKGGGEMKMSLNPQGMGEVNLRVRMVEGNVNVEMVTESNEAKKVLEKGLAELKDSLATHKLHLDSIKIESGREASNKFGDQQSEFDRSQQQRFLGDFQQRNSNFRREMFELPGPSIPSSQTQDQAANNLYDPKAKKRTDSTRRLDLVA